MRGERFLRLFPVLLAVGGCQVIADLSVPTYRASGGGGPGGGGGASSSSSGSGGSTHVDSGGEGGCTASDAGDDLPPCLEHLQMWFVADDQHLNLDGDGNVTRWDDASSFGWVAKPAPGAVAKVIPRARGSRSAVHLAKGGMGVVKDRVLHLPSVGVYAAIRWESFPPTNDFPNHPYGIGDIFCLGSDATENRLETYVKNEDPAQQHMPGARFHAKVQDQSGAQNDLIVDREFDAGLWDIYGTGFACDDCLTKDAGAGLMGRIFRGQYAGAGGPLVPVSLDRFVATWTYKWSDVRLGGSCGDNSALEDTDIDLGEFLLYDTFLDDDMNMRVTQYLAAHWAG